jgi:hypothetical protein
MEPFKSFLTEETRGNLPLRRQRSVPRITLTLFLLRAGFRTHKHQQLPLSILSAFNSVSANITFPTFSLLIVFAVFHQCKFCLIHYRLRYSEKKMFFLNKTQVEIKTILLHIIWLEITTAITLPFPQFLF